MQVHCANHRGGWRAFNKNVKRDFVFINQTACSVLFWSVLKRNRLKIISCYHFWALTVTTIKWIKERKILNITDVCNEVQSHTIHHLLYHYSLLGSSWRQFHLDQKSSEPELKQTWSFSMPLVLRMKAQNTTKERGGYFKCLRWKSSVIMKSERMNSNRFS